MIARKLLLGLGCAAVLAIPITSSAVTVMSVGMSFKGIVTMVAPSGLPIRNSAFQSEPEFEGWRTPVTGLVVFNFDSGGNVLSGKASFDPFTFSLGGIITGVASGRDITFVPTQTILGIPTNTLLIGNFLFDFGSVETGIPVSLVLDIGTLSTSLLASPLGTILTGTPSILTAASEDTLFDGEQRPIGPVLVSTTRFNVTDVDTDGDGNPGPIAHEVNPSGTTPLIVDTAPNPFSASGTPGIGGSPIRVGLFTNFNPNFDFREVTVKCTRLLSECALGESSILGILPIAPPAIPLSAKPLKGLGLLGL